MNKLITTRQIVITGLMLALEIILQIIGNYVQLGPISLNLSLVAIVMAAVLAGPLSGAVVGFFNGIMVIVSPSTLSLFMTTSVIGTFLACLTKCTIAGLVAGFVFKALVNKNKVLALVLAGLLVPVINTGLFCLYCLLFFRPLLERLISPEYANIYIFLLLGFVGWNFIFEVISTPVLSTSVGLVVLREKK